MTTPSAKELAEKYLKQQELAAKRQQKYREKRREQGYKNISLSVKENTKNLIDILIELCEKNSNAEINQKKIVDFFDSLRNQTEEKTPEPKPEQVAHSEPEPKPKTAKPRTRKKAE